MTVIRGATTIEKDCKEEISLSVKELLDEIFRENHLKKEEVRSVIFSLTTDIHSYHPAKAARESGYAFCPLFACTEPDIEGGLKLCIRVMVSIEPADGLRDVKHVYLKGAKGLRQDISSVYNIALERSRGERQKHDCQNSGGRLSYFIPRYGCDVPRVRAGGSAAGDKSASGFRSKKSYRDDRREGGV